MTVMFTLVRKKKTKQTESMRDSLCTGHFTVVYLVAKSLIWSKAESNLVVVETSVKHNNKAIYL